MFQKQVKLFRPSFSCQLLLGIFLSFSCSHGLLADDNNNSEKKLLDQFIQSRGNSIISFDASNIKLFWISPGNGQSKVKQGHQNIPLIRLYRQEVFLCFENCVV